MPAATTAPTAAERAELATALEDLLSWGRRLVPPGDLSLAATGLLARLARDGGSGVSALARAEGVTQPAMSQMVARLERDGLVTRAADPADGRAAVVALTATGRHLVEDRRASRAAALLDLLDGAGDDDAATLARAAPALARLARRATTSLSTSSSQTPGRTPLP